MAGADAGDDAAVDLEAAALASVLFDEPLPGWHQPVSLADLGLAIDDDGKVRVLNDGNGSVQAARLIARLAASHQGADRGLVVVDATELDRAGPVAAAVRVSSTTADDAVTVRIEVCARPSPTADLVALETVTIEFMRRHGSWVVAEPPRHLAT